MAYGSSDVPATDFAITTVNVPDRLDLRDMDDRKQLEDGSRQRSFDPAVLRAWLPRITLLGVLAIIVFLLWQVVDNWKNSLSAGVLSSRFTASLGVPIMVENSQFALTPSPRLLLTKVTINNDVVLNQVAIRLTSRHIAQAFQSHGLNWGETTIGPSKISIAQGHDLLQLLPKLDGALPRGIGLLHFEDLQFPDQPWLKGAWKVDMERSGNNGFTRVLAHQSTETGSLQVQLTPESPELVDFQIQIHHWVLPFGFATAVETAAAEGKVSYSQLDVSQFSVSGPFGEIHGTLNGADDGGWKVSGVAQTDGVDVDALLRQVAPPGKPESAGAESTPIAQGVATFSGRIDGAGPTLTDAVDTSQLVAPLHVRSAVLNGINLGFIAMNPSSSPDANGGSTRFSALDAQLIVGGRQTTLRDLHARAGALLALGEFNVQENHELSGLIHVDLGATRVLAPIRVRVRGTLLQPKFGR
jgi:hypothetical protein